MIHLQQHLGPDASPAWEALDEAVAGLDFERALRLCRPLLAEEAA